MSRYENPPDAQQYYVPSQVNGAPQALGYLSEPRATCSQNKHYFNCKHENVCNCGMTERLPLEVDEGL